MYTTNFVFGAARTRATLAGGKARKLNDKRHFGTKLFDKRINMPASGPKVVTEEKLDFKDVLIRPQLTTLRSRSLVDLNREFTFKHSSSTWKGVPIMAANMDTVGTFEVAEVLSRFNMITCLHKHYSADECSQWAEKVGADVLKNVAVSAGTSEGDQARVTELLDQMPDVKFICLDVANGYQRHFVAKVEEYRASFPDKIILAGNVVTSDLTEILLKAGADIVKLGIGPGSVCTTRKQTGVGFPQLSTILENTEIAKKLGGHIISDGGCTIPGDFSKAFGAGADFIMSGGMLAGHNESGGETVFDEATGRMYKKFYGMSSDIAMDQYSGGVASYRSSEGKLVLLPLKGPIEDTIVDLLGGIRSTCTYIGASTLEEMQDRTTFVKVSQQLNEVYGKAPDRFESFRA